MLVLHMSNHHGNIFSGAHVAKLLSTHTFQVVGCLMLSLSIFLTADCASLVQEVDYSFSKPFMEVVESFAPQ